MHMHDTILKNALLPLYNNQSLSLFHYLADLSQRSYSFNFHLSETGITHGGIVYFARSRGYQKLFKSPWHTLPKYTCSPRFLFGTCCSLYSYLCGVLYIIVCRIVPLLIYNWPLYCLFFDMRLLVTLWYLQTFLTCSNEPFEWKVSASLKLQLYMVAVFIFIKKK